MVGIDNYRDILTDPDIWRPCRRPRISCSGPIALETCSASARLLIDRKFRGHGFWTTIILLPMMLSPAVVGNFWTFLYQPQIGLFNYACRSSPAFPHRRSRCSAT
jgi:multiple sugar transport system permease protein